VGARAFHPMRFVLWGSEGRVPRRDNVSLYGSSKNPNPATVGARGALQNRRGPAGSIAFGRGAAISARQTPLAKLIRHADLQKWLDVQGGWPMDLVSRFARNELLKREVWKGGPSADAQKVKGK